MARSSFRVLYTLTAILCAVSGVLAQEQPAPDVPADVVLRVQAVRVTRSTAEMQRQFRGRYSSDGAPGVWMQLLLSPKDATVLPLSRDAVEINTFVDDTYQNLLVGPAEARYQQPPMPTVSDDGRHVLLVVSSSRAPADEAGRVFVRGSLRARVARGELRTAAQPMPIRAGAQAAVGHFHTTLRSISDAGRHLTLTLAVTGDAARIRKVRALGQDGRQLNEERELRLIPTGMVGAEESTTFHLLIPPGQEAVTLEYSFAEKLESVNIPFEVQIDIGQTKGGPLEPVAEGAPRPAQERLEPQARPWPPPPPVPQALPPRRAPFDPSKPAAQPGGENAAAVAKPEKAAVDVFSLTVGKPAPGEVKNVQWAHPPALRFRPSGFTIVRLLLTTPDATIIAVPPEGVTVARFEDDTGTHHPTTVYRETSSRSSSRGPGAFLSQDGRQALLSVSLASAPAPGATRCTLAGSVNVKVTRGERLDVGDAVPLAKGQQLKVGPYQVTFGDVRQMAPLNPGSPNPGEVEVWVHLRGPLHRVRSIELLDAATNEVLGTRDLFRDEDGGFEESSFGVVLRNPNIERLVGRIRHFEKAETVEIPFDLSIGIGL